MQLQFLLLRAGQLSHRAGGSKRAERQTLVSQLLSRRHLSLFEASTVRREASLCALFESHERLRTSDKLLAQTFNRLAAYHVMHAGAAQAPALGSAPAESWRSSNSRGQR